MSTNTVTDLKKQVAVAAAPRLSAAEMKQAQPINTIRQLIESQKTEIARALPKHMDADRLARIAFTTIRSNNAIARCSAESLLGGLMTCAQLGLEPGPLGHAYFVPYGKEVTFILGYKGMIELALRSGKITSLIAREVYEHDEFDVAYGLEDALRHKPRILGERGEVVAYYAVAKLVGGGHAFVVMSKPDIEKIRKRSKAGNSGPWQTDYDAMAKKTCVRRLFTFLPSSVEIAQAISQDGAVRTDFTAEAIDEAPAFVEGELVPDADPTTGEILDGEIEPDGAWPPVAGAE